MVTEGVPKIGVVLGGGGVRGFAHLGVLQVMEEVGVPVDLIAGTSMGGIVAGLYAAGVPLREIAASATKTGIMDLASADRAWRGLFNHRKMAALLAELLGRQDVSFEDLRIPAAVVAADVETSEVVVLDKGPLIPALIATSAVPLLFSPVLHQGRWLVDGGTLNNLPVDIARRMGADRVLAVSVPPRLTLPLEEREEERGLSARGLLFFSSRTRDWRLPFLIAEASLGMTEELVDRMRLAYHPPDLFLEVDLPNVGLLDADSNAKIIKAGREAATRRLTELLALKTEPPPAMRQRPFAGAAQRLRRAWAVLREGEDPSYPEGRMAAFDALETGPASSRSEKPE
jgi:NTE family protein